MKIKTLEDKSVRKNDFVDEECEDVTHYQWRA